MRALYGHPELGQVGFRNEIKEQVRDLREEIQSTRTLCEDLRQERRDELSERKGLRKAVGYTGVTNFLTLFTLLGLIFALWQGVFGGA